MGYNGNSLGSLPVPEPESNRVFWAGWARLPGEVETAHSRQNEIAFLHPPPERMASLTAAAAAQVRWQQLVAQGEAGVWLGCGRHRNEEGDFLSDNEWMPIL